MSPPRPAAVIVLAAGAGTRMRSATPKVLHTLCGRPLLGHALAAARELDPQHLVTVIGHGRERVSGYLADSEPGVRVAVQDRQLGTGHAVRCALEGLPDLDGTVVVTYGDVPLLQGSTLVDLVDRHTSNGDAVTVLTARVDDPTGYGRIVREADGSVGRIVEHRDADARERALTEINSGVYAFRSEVLTAGLARLTSANAGGELYLTDVLSLARGDGGRVSAVLLEDPWQTEGVNDRVQLAGLRAELNRRTVTAWMRAGVTVEDPATTWVDVQVELAPDVTLRPGVQLQGLTRVEEGASIGPDSTLRDTTVGPGAEVVRAHCDGAVVGAGASVGPYTFLRPGTVLGERTRAGAYVEIKGSTVGDGSKVPHLSYVGDADIGVGSNIGAATIVVNYDGVGKHRTSVGDHVRIGSDTMLVAPVRVGDGAYTAAGSVITDDVPAGAMAVARGRQRNVEGWVARRRPGTPSAQAAERAHTDTPADPADPAPQANGEETAR